jgi:tRNA nucleotidyltransferase (CCA-adding enzyme)
MRLILTHENADFDAIASLFAASLLDERALPVLPRRLNRNVRAFLTLYGGDFSFVDPRDIPREKIHSILLVDTQSLITLKGMGKETKIRVIDHHPRKKTLPSEWEISLEEIGAATTRFIERLQEIRPPLSTAQATLLLLGIYEDTGSLTYASVTPRDIRAAAWLLEAGASLQLATDFLNPPLSPAQRKLYESLAESAETHLIHGRRVTLACGDAREIQDEVSSLAHKLRDRFDSDAVFLLVMMKDGVRLVARTTTDALDAGAVAAHFGGGGHERAAAALIHYEGKSPPHVLEETCRALLDYLPHCTRPAKTVGEIMSRSPQTLSPETSAAEAAKLMQRYGYEGYPIVENGRVVGLLTRRAVDRARAHRLNLTAASLMKAGEVTVSPHDSIQTLQLRMIDSGWGQIPVVEEGKIIGIVTRTDLLKTLAPSELPPSRRNIAARLEASLPDARLRLVRAVSKIAAEEDMALYLVGGFVRDVLLNRPSLDFDFVVEGDAIALAKSVARHYGGRVTAHSRFGTAKWFFDEKVYAHLDTSADALPLFVDFISARTEFYESPTALPTVSRGSIKLDLHRRDFTINTLAIRLDGHHYGELHDYWGGLADLERGIVRVLHSLSFVDDPTRMLRAVRFEQRFGFHISPRTLDLMAEARPLLKKLSGQRLRHEIDLILDEPKAADMLARLAALHLLEEIHPALQWDSDAASRVTAAFVLAEKPLPPLDKLPPRRAAGYLAWLLPLTKEDCLSLSKKLRFHAALRRALCDASALAKDIPSLRGAPPSVWTRRLENTHPILAHLFAALYPRERAFREYLDHWHSTRPITDGNLLKTRGLAPGPRYKIILSRLRDAWLDGKIQTEEEELALLDSLLKEEKPPAASQEAR